MNDVINFEDYKKNKNKDDYKNVKVLMTINDLEIILDYKTRVEKFINLIQEIDISKINQEEFIKIIREIKNEIRI
tara:strand:+ start:897 stop:1121 length:225 start_codon:yes stop_codon:yes gene_type:complete